MTSKKKKIIALVLWLIIGVIIYLSFKLKNDEVNEITSNHYEVVGNVSNISFKTIEISYSINRKIYNYIQNKPYSNLNVGEEFYTLVSRNDLNRAFVFFTKPILDTNKFKYGLIDPNYVDKLIIDRNEISFSYQVEEKKYDRIQKYEDGKRPNNLQNLKVKYRIDHPEIGYLVLK